jgi:two-component system nitrogen regulation sensor histidine kinase NtrY
MPAQPVQPDASGPSPAPGASAPAPAADALALSPKERRRRRRELWLGAVVLAVLSGLFTVEPLADFLQGTGEGGLFLFLNGVTVILIAVLAMIVTRNLWKLVLERRRGTLGSHLTARFASAFVLIAFVTTSGLFVVSAFVITGSMDRWFSVQLDRALVESDRIARSTTESTALRALAAGSLVAEAIAREGLLAPGRRDELEALVERWQREQGLGVVEVFGASGQELLSSVNPEVPAASFAHAGSELVVAALAGEPRYEVEASAGGDVVRAAVPVGPPGAAVTGALVVNATLPLALSKSVASVRKALAEYRALEPTAGHIRTTYLLELLLAAVVILMLALWLSVRLAKGVTGPIRALAEGTAEIARGNLDVEVQRSSDDEIGFLVGSFNRMTRDLRDARARLTHSNAELERRRRYMEVVLGTVGAGVVSVDAEGRVGAINPAAEHHLGVPAGVSVLGAPLADVARRPEVQGVIAELSHGLRPGRRESLRRQVQVMLGDDLATLLVTATLLHDDAGGPLGTVFVLDDCTQVVKVQRMAAWREVARRIAHEIKNPLTPIQLSAQRMRRRFRPRLDQGGDDLRVFDECVDTITSQVEGLKLLVDEFSNFARLPTSSPRPDDLNRLIADAVASYAGTEDVRFETELDANLPTVDIDREQIRRALTNLIDNAIAAVRRHGSGGHVGLRSRYDPSLQSVRLEVSDDGVGVPVEDRRRIFEPYYSTKKDGTGLGLSIVSRIVADHRGYIRVQENDPHGARFVVDLPVRGA